LQYFRFLLLLNEDIHHFVRADFIHRTLLFGYANSQNRRSVYKKNRYVLCSGLAGLQQSRDGPFGVGVPFK